MKKILLTLLILPVFVSAEPWVDYELSEEVIEMTVVTVKPGMKDDYLMGIKKTWVDACKIQKNLVILLDAVFILLIQQEQTQMYSLQLDMKILQLWDQIKKNIMNLLKHGEKRYLIQSKRVLLLVMMICVK